MLLHEHPNKRYLPVLERAEPLIMDSTASKGLKKCPRYYFYRFVLGRVLKQDSIVLQFGKFYHKFRELLELQDLKAALACLDDYKPDIENAGKFSYLTRQRLIETCLKAYEHSTNEKAKGAIKVIAVEQPFNVQLPDGTFIGGRADQIVEWNGKLWGRDFKTTSKIQSFFARECDPADQAMRYIYGESKLHFGNDCIERGKYIAGIIFQAIYNEAKKGPEIYNVISSRDLKQIREWENEQILINQVLAMYRDADIWPMHETYNCRFCEYAKVCRMPSDTGKIQVLKSDYHFSPWDHQNVDQEHDT